MERDEGALRPEVADRIAEIKARLEKATPGPWFWNSYSGVYSACCEVSGKIAPKCYPKEGSAEYHDEEHCTPVVAWVPPSYGDTATGKHAADAVFIEHARADVPWLLEQVERLVALVGVGREPQEVPR